MDIVRFPRMLTTNEPANRDGERDDDSSASGFLQKILGLFGMGGADADKKRLLKNIGKDLSRSRYKFYKPKSAEALPGLARFFYETYKVIAPAQVMLTTRPSRERSSPSSSRAS